MTDRIATLEVGYRMPAHLIGDILKELPTDTRIITMWNASGGIRVILALTSTFFPETPAWEEAPEVKVKYGHKVHDYRAEMFIEEVDWPKAVEFAGLKRNNQT